MKLVASRQEPPVENERGFVCDRDGRIVANSQENIKKAVGKLGVELSHNIFAGKLLANGEMLTDSIYEKLWLDTDRRFKFRPARDFFETVIRVMAREKPFHPVRDYLDGLRWDGTERIDTWLVTYGGAADSSYVRAVGGITLVAAVKRIRQPGCKHDEMLILEGGQGFNKSTALRTLCPDPDWFSDDLPLGLDSKRTIEATLGKWIIEAAELSGMRKSQVEQLKASLSRQVDGPCRLAYGRYPVDQPRSFIIIGTTNAQAYLRDQTGNRRFWPVKVPNFLVKKLARDRDQLWAEAARREQQGQDTRLPAGLYAAAGRHQEDRRTVDPWEAKLGELFSDYTIPIRVTTDEVWDTMHVSVKDRTEAGAERLASILHLLGFRRVSIRREGMVKKGWSRDPGF